MKNVKLSKIISAATAVALASLLIFGDQINAGILLKASPSQEITAENIVFKAPTADNPLGGASDFNGVIFGNLTNFRDTEGPVAGMGEVSVGAQICARADGTPYLSHQNWIYPDEIDDGIPAEMNVGLILGGNGSSSSPVHNGAVIVGENASYTGTEYPSIIKSSAADTFMADAKRLLTEQNQVLFNKSSNGSIIYNAEMESDWSGAATYGGTVIVLKGTNSDWNIFKIDMSDTRLSTAAWVFDIPAGSKVLINVTTTDPSKEITMTNGSNNVLQFVCPGQPSYSAPFLGSSSSNAKSATAEFAGRVLWNVDPEVTKVTYRNGSNYIFGSLLAPNADFQSIGGDDSVNGTLVANNATGAGGSELHWFKFGGASGGDGEETTTPPIIILTTPTESSPVTTPEPPVTTPEPPVTTPEPPVTTPEPPVTTPEPPVTTPEPPVTTPEPPVTTPEPPVTTPEPPVTTPEPPVTTPEPPVTTPEPPVTTPEPPVTTPEPPVTTPEPPVTTPEPPVTTPESPVTTPEPPVTTPESPVTTPEPPVTTTAGTTVSTIVTIPAVPVTSVTTPRDPAVIIGTGTGTGMISSMPIGIPEISGIGEETTGSGEVTRPDGTAPGETLLTGTDEEGNVSTPKPQTSGLDLGAGVDDHAEPIGNTNLFILVVCGIGAITAMLLIKTGKRQKK